MNAKTEPREEYSRRWGLTPGGVADQPMGIGIRAMGGSDNFLPHGLTEGRGRRSIARSRGQILALAGEWNGESLAPPGARPDGRVLRL